MTCTSCGAENREGARFCDSCGAALAVAARREQRKVVTVLFCDVSGSTAFAESRDPEAVRAVMGRYFDVARTAIERHGGTVEKFIGDAVMAVFGVPTIREDDALRAVRAAAELRDAVEVPVRIGVNTGEVVTGSGDSLGGVYADLLARAGRADEAEEILAEVERIAGPDDFLTACQAAAAPALVASARGEHERAVELARSAVSIADAAEYATQRHDAWMELGEVLLAAGRADEARDALATARELAVRKGSTAIVDRIDALLAEQAATPSRAPPASAPRSGGPA